MTQILSVFSWTFLAWLGCLAAVSFVTADFILDLARRRRYRRMAKRVRMDSDSAPIKNVKSLH